MLCCILRLSLRYGAVELVCCPLRWLSTCMPADGGCHRTSNKHGKCWSSRAYQVPELYMLATWQGCTGLVEAPTASQHGYHGISSPAASKF